MIQGIHNLMNSGEIARPPAADHLQLPAADSQVHEDGRGGECRHDCHRERQAARGCSPVRSLC